MNIVLEFDDLHWKMPENCITEIQTLVAAVPDIKLSFFTVPMHSHIPLFANPSWCDKIRTFITSGNIRLAVHGLLHTELEFKIDDKNIIAQKLSKAEYIFYKAGLPFTRVFKGPYWGISKATYDVLADKGYIGVYSHETYKHITGLTTVFYNWNLKDNPPTNIDTIIAHGHTHNVCGNGIKESIPKIIEFIKKNNPTFKFVDEIL